MQRIMVRRPLFIFHFQFSIFNSFSVRSQRRGRRAFGRDEQPSAPGGCGLPALRAAFSPTISLCRLGRSRQRREPAKGRSLGLR